MTSTYLDSQDPRVGIWLYSSYIQLVRYDLVRFTRLPVTHNLQMCGVPDTTRDRLRWEVGVRVCAPCAYKHEM